MVSSRMKEPLFTPIYAVYHKPESGCEFFKPREREGYYIVECLVLERLLTKDHVIKCENYWKTCPFRKIGLQMMGETVKDER